LSDSRHNASVVMSKRSRDSDECWIVYAHVTLDPGTEETFVNVHMVAAGGSQNHQLTPDGKSFPLGWSPDGGQTRLPFIRLGWSVSGGSLRL
jgi:hypothetical protein